MKRCVAIFTIFLAASCSQNPPANQGTTSNTDSLTAHLDKMMEKYAPGLGEIMGGIQTHHAKLWCAGVNDNWKLCEYEIDEIRERFEQAAEIETSRPEVKMIPMIYPAIDSVASAIKQKNKQAFTTGFQLLTNSCNSCHTANHFEFNVITIPTAPPVTNQDFKVH
ncbi:MAG: hypothetical protein ABI863_03895 [Ginsengibacter sp.]